MTTLTIYMVRHAPVTGKQGVIYGDDADIDLESTAARIYELSGLLPSPEKSVWYHSGVDRAHRTARAVLSIMQKEQAQITSHDGFREQHFGSLIGCKHEDITDHLRFIDGKIFAPAPPGGETIPEFIARVETAINDLKDKAQQEDKKNIVVFCHGGTIRAAHATIKGLDAEQFISLDTPPLFAYQSDIYRYGAYKIKT